MKTIKILFFAAFISIAAFSCSTDDDKSDDTTENNEAKIIGTWKFTSSSTNGFVDTDNYICDFEDIWVINASTVAITFYADPSGMDGSNCQFDGIYTYDYEINGDIISDDEGNSKEILTLNDTTLIFEEIEIYGGTTYRYTDTYIKQ